MPSAGPERVVHDTGIQKTPKSSPPFRPFTRCNTVRKFYKERPLADIHLRDNECTCTFSLFIVKNIKGVV